MTITISIGTADDDSNNINDDVDALARLIKNENSTLIDIMEEQGLTHAQALRVATETIVAEVINRAASNSTTVYGGTTIQGVIDHARPNASAPQYSGVQKNAEGQYDWHTLDVAETEYVDAVKSYLSEKVLLGTGSTLIGASATCWCGSMRTPTATARAESCTR